MLPKGKSHFIPLVKRLRQPRQSHISPIGGRLRRRTLQVTTNMFEPGQIDISPISSRLRRRTLQVTKDISPPGKFDLSPIARRLRRHTLQATAPGKSDISPIDHRTSFSLSNSELKIPEVCDTSRRLEAKIPKIDPTFHIDLVNLKASKTSRSPESKSNENVPCFSSKLKTQENSTSETPNQSQRNFTPNSKISNKNDTSCSTESKITVKVTSNVNRGN